MIFVALIRIGPHHDAYASYTTIILSMSDAKPASRSSVASLMYLYLNYAIRWRFIVGFIHCDAKWQTNQKTITPWWFRPAAWTLADKNHPPGNTGCSKTLCCFSTPWGWTATLRTTQASIRTSTADWERRGNQNHSCCWNSVWRRLVGSRRSRSSARVWRWTWLCCRVGSSLLPCRGMILRGLGGNWSVAPPVGIENKM